MLDQETLLLCGRGHRPTMADTTSRSTSSSVAAAAFALKISSISPSEHWDGASDGLTSLSRSSSSRSASLARLPSSLISLSLSICGKELLYAITLSDLVLLLERVVASVPLERREDVCRERLFERLEDMFCSNSLRASRDRGVKVSGKAGTVAVLWSLVGSLSWDKGGDGGFVSTSWWWWWSVLVLLTGRSSCGGPGDSGSSSNVLFRNCCAMNSETLDWTLRDMLRGMEEGCFVQMQHWRADCETWSAFRLTPT